MISNYLPILSQMTDFYMKCYAELRWVNWKSGVETTTLCKRSFQISRLILSEFKRIDKLLFPSKSLENHQLIRLNSSDIRSEIWKHP